MVDFTKPHKPPRLPNYDYTAPGYYFVTFNAKQRGQNVFSKIDAVGTAPLGGPSLVLTQAGKIVDELIKNVDRVYPNTHVDTYVIMPDHVHMILVLGCVEQGGPPRGAAPTVPVGQIVNAIKALATKRIGCPLWQDEYYDHVLRNDADLRETRQYIGQNPLKARL